MPDTPHTKLLVRKISEFCRLRVDPILPPQESARIRNFLVGLIARSQTPPRKLRGYDWEEIALRCGLDKEALRIAKSPIEPALDAIARYTPFPLCLLQFKGRASSSTRPPPPAANGESVTQKQ